MVVSSSIFSVIFYHFPSKVLVIDGYFRWTNVFNRRRHSIRNGFHVLLCVNLWFVISVRINIGCESFDRDIRQRKISSLWHDFFRAIQCNLPINLFNELIFFIIWCWLIVLVGLSVFSLIFFLVTSFNKNQRRTIEKLLYANSHQLNVDEEIDFFRNYLRTDGILVLRILSQNINDVSMSKLVDRLYQIKLKSRW